MLLQLIGGSLCFWNLCWFKQEGLCLSCMVSACQQNMPGGAGLCVPVMLNGENDAGKDKKAILILMRKI